MIIRSYMLFETIEGILYFLNVAAPPTLHCSKIPQNEFTPTKS